MRRMICVKCEKNVGSGPGFIRVMSVGPYVKGVGFTAYVVCDDCETKPQPVERR